MWLIIWVVVGKIYKILNLNKWLKLIKLRFNHSPQTCINWKYKEYCNWYGW
jgi:hypothetical protein